jgi:TatD DNase family protein
LTAFQIFHGLLLPFSSEQGSALVASLPVERLLTETDGPFLQIEGRSARPRNVTRCVAQLSEALAAPALPTRLDANLKGLLAAVGAK